MTPLVTGHYNRECFLGFPILDERLASKALLSGSDQAESLGFSASWRKVVGGTEWSGLTCHDSTHYLPTIETMPLV